MLERYPRRPSFLGQAPGVLSIPLAPRTVGALVAKASKQASVAQHILPVRAGERVRVAAKTAARQWESRAQRRRLFIWRPPPLRIDTKVDLNCTKGRMTTAARSA